MVDSVKHLFKIYQYEKDDQIKVIEELEVEVFWWRF